MCYNDKKNSIGISMSNLVWVVDGQFKDEGYIKFMELLDRYGLDYHIVKVVPFVGEMIPKPEIGGNKNIICFGAYSMRHIAKRNGWYPGVIDMEYRANEIYYNKWYPYVLNRDFIECYFGDIGDIVREAGWESEWFMRPVSDSKCFAGQVCTMEEYLPWRHGVVELSEDDGTNLRGNTKCIVAPCINIMKEWRIFVVNDVIVTGSLYKVGERVHYDSLIDDDVYEFVNKLISLEPSFAECYVIDIARIESGLRVIEVNTMNSAGFYKSDVSGLIMCLEELYG